MARKHLNLWVIADAPMRRAIPELDTKIEESLATAAIRARCYSSEYILQVNSDMDWNLRIALIGATIQTCDAVIVVGDKLTDAMTNELEIVKSRKKTIATSKLSVFKYIKKMGLEVKCENIDAFCSSLVKEVLKQ